MDIPIDLNREEDFLVEAMIDTGDNFIDFIPCRVYLPERFYEKPYLLFESNIDTAEKMITSEKKSFKAVKGGITIEASEIYFSGFFSGRNGKLTKTTFPGEPQDLHIIEQRPSVNIDNKTHIFFWISQNKLLTPKLLLVPLDTGEVFRKDIQGLSFIIGNNLEVVFDKRFNYKKEKNGDTKRWSFLVASTGIDISASDAKAIKNGVLQKIDDFLLLASFATKRRTACLGWSAIDRHVHTKFYRGYYSFPQPDDSDELEDGIIENGDFKTFMESSYSLFLNFNNKDAFRKILHAAVPSKNRILESSFLNMFAGLESLVLDFRRGYGMEFILPESSWKSFKDYLEKCIKNSTEPIIEKNQRKMIYSKLNELNRVSLKEAFDAFCEHYSVELADLWPVFAENRKSVSLSDIRNKIIHGDPFPSRLIKPLIVAHEHLEYVFQRMIIRVLGWSIDKTNLNKVHYNSIKDMPQAMQKLSIFIKLGESY
jgi:hypothetical protein